MKKVYGYVRVSDVKQVDGASLSEQERAIQEYATKNQLSIIHWFRETKTAAKRGRPFFEKMMRQLKKGKADGVIIHKIDRSARNLHDWAAIGDLIDNNIDVHFAHESLDMTERGGRLSADIQAVMASDYVRNLRQEAIKGLYGRLKQGIYPFRAPVGYLNNGRGQVKTVDPIHGHLILKLFELYVYKEHSILTLVPKMKKLGLKNWRGNPLDKNGISRVLNNPFYTGVMKVRGLSFKGKHEAIISVRLYEQAQLKLNGNKRPGGLIHNYLFRGMIRCGFCKRMMSGEMQKGRVYYRCQTQKCPTKSIRQDYAERRVKGLLKQINVSNTEYKMLKEIIEEENEDKKYSIEEQMKAILLEKSQVQQKEKRMLDAYLDNVIDKKTYNRHSHELNLRSKDLDQRKKTISEDLEEKHQHLLKSLELCKNPIKMYDLGILEEKQRLIKIVTSNFVARGKSLEFLPHSPYAVLANRDMLSVCEHNRDIHRILLSPFIYSDKNTTEIIPQSLNQSGIQHLFSFLKINFNS